MPQPVRMLCIANKSLAPAGNRITIPRTTLFNGYGESLRVKRPGPEGEYSPPSIAKVKNVYSLLTVFNELPRRIFGPETDKATG
jgi:hypothetical protein